MICLTADSGAARGSPDRSRRRSDLPVRAGRQAGAVPEATGEMGLAGKAAAEGARPDRAIGTARVEQRSAAASRRRSASHQQGGDLDFVEPAFKGAVVETFHLGGQEPLDKSLAPHFGN